jgi:hypothetical protein
MAPPWSAASRVANNNSISQSHPTAAMSSGIGDPIASVDLGSMEWSASACDGLSND